MRFSSIGLLIALVCLCGAAPAGAERKTYDLRYRPILGQRWAYEQSTDSTLTVEMGINRANVKTTNKYVRHSQLVVKCDETLEVADGKCTAKRVTFGKGCFSFDQQNDEPRRDHRLVYSDKTVTFRMLPDGTLDQDFGVKASGKHMRLLRDAVLGRNTIFPNRAVAVGDRWRADEVLRDVMELRPDDTISTVFTLKAVREQDGRQVADVAASAAVLMNERGLNLEMGLEGTYVVDVETGVPIKIDLVGQTSTAGSADARGVTLTGSGTYEFHRAARQLPPAPLVAGAAP
jgi:hypothetical protein